jgi:hypothetical protein
MILYLIVGIISLILLFFIYIRIKFKFWAIQPVFHFYDIYYWFVNVGIINKDLPQINKYTNFKQIKTFEFTKLNKLTKKNFIQLIQLNYLRNGQNKFYPNSNNIIPYFLGHNSKCFWSYYYTNEPIIYNKTNKIIQNNKIIAVITSRPLHVKIKSYRKDSSFDVYYVDYLCVDKLWRNKNIAPQLIQTHEYNQSHTNKHIVVSLFKREEELTGIIPLTIYKSYCFFIQKLRSVEHLNARITMLDGDKQNIFYLYNFINEQTNKWDIIIFPEITNLIELCVTKNIYIKMLLVNQNIEAIYIFKKTCTFVEDNKELLSLICSVHGNKISKDEFINGFYISLYSIIQTNKKYLYLNIEDVSNNTSIINDICYNVHPIKISPMAYFFYNFAYNSFKSNKCLIIN